MKKSIREQKMKEIGEEIIARNRVMCHAKDNKSKMVAMQRAYALLGMLLGLAEMDYYNPILMEIRDKQEDMFGEWAITDPSKFFYKFPTESNE